MLICRVKESPSSADSTSSDEFIGLNIILASYAMDNVKAEQFTG